MRMPRLLALSTLSTVAVATASCTTPINPKEVADHVADGSREVVHQTGGGIGFAESSDSGLRTITTGLSDASSNVMGMPAPMPAAMTYALKHTSIAAVAAGMPSIMTTEEQFDSTADQIKVWVRERVLADANLESTADDQAVYLLHPDPTCRQLPQDGDPPDVIPPLNSKCVDQLTKLPVRVVLRADGDGGRLTILIGADRLELSTFIVHSNSIAVEVDLAKAYAATQEIDQTLGTDSPSASHYDALSGKLRLSLTKNGEKNVTGAYSVLEAINVSTLDSSGALGPAVKMAASDPTFSVTGDGVNQTVTAKVAMGKLDVSGDWDPQGTLPPNRDLHFSIGGIFSQTTFTNGVNTIVGKGVGFGTIEYDVRGQQFVTLALNPNNGNKFDYQLSLDANNKPQITLTPAFDLSIGAHLGVIASQLTSAPPSYELDETYRIYLDGGGAAAGVLAVPQTATFDGGLKITAGTLTFSTTSTDQTVVVPAGKCLTTISTPPAGAHPLLGKLAVVDCP
jgi:hypothetical protein